MTTLLVILIVSLAGLCVLIFSKIAGLRYGSHGAVTRLLSRYDERVARALVVVAQQFGHMSFTTKQVCVILLRRAGAFVTTELHHVTLAIERKLRVWGEMARERKIQPRNASAFLKNVIDHKSEMKQAFGPRLGI